MDVFEIIEIMDLAEIAEMNNPERSYQVRPRVDHFNHWSDQEFFVRFRLSKPSVTLLLQKIEDYLHHPSRRNLNRAIQPLDQLLIALRFLATGNFYVTMGDFSGIHKSTVGKIINRVISSIVNLLPQYIYFPDTEDKRQRTMAEFYQIARFPKVVGAIDCTHIKLQSPGGPNAEVFRNRKGWFSLNIQVVCDAEYRIIDIVTRWPGSTHDSHIFNNSSAKMKFEAGQMHEGVLLGDSGYPSKNYLFTPLLNPTSPQEILYNESQIRTRNIVERVFGIWKRRFPILSLGIRCKIELAQKIIVASAILHNLACQEGEEYFEDHVEAIDDNQEQHLERADEQDGQEARSDLINNYFRNLLN